MAWSGSYTVGIGGDYASWSAVLTALFADRSLSGDTTFTQISDITDSGYEQWNDASVTLNGHKLTFVSSSPFQGDPTACYKTIWNADCGGNYAILLVIDGVDSVIGGGSVEMSGLYVQNQLTNGAGCTTIGATDYNEAGDCTADVHDCFVDMSGTAIPNAYGIYSYGSDVVGGASSSHIWNCLATGGRVGLATDGGILENSSAYDAMYGIQTGGVSDVRNCISAGSSSADVSRSAGTANGYNNATSDGSAQSAAIFNGALSGGIINIVIADEVVSLDPEAADYFKLVDGTLDDAGMAPAIAENTAGVRGTARPHDGVYSIGADEYAPVPVTVKQGKKAKEIQLNWSSFAGLLRPSVDTNVQLAMERLDASVRLNNFAAARDPSSIDDSIDGYGAGSLWLNTATPSLWLCTDATPTAAVWYEIPLGSPISSSSSSSPLGM